jgi:hypothetical protein
MIRVTIHKGVNRMKKSSIWFRGLVISLILALVVPTLALAAGPVTQETFFICPSVSLNNSNGMWVVGTHGAYYVLVPTKGNTGDKVYLTIPVQVPSLAQVPAGWALYNSLPSYPNFEGMAVLLQEGVDTWLGSANVYGWAEGTIVSVMNNGNGTYTVANLMDASQSVTIDHSIPLASAAVW